LTLLDEKPKPKQCPFCNRQVVPIDPQGGQRSCQAEYEYTQIKHVIGEPPCFLDKHSINLKEWESRPEEDTLHERIKEVQGHAVTDIKAELKNTIQLRQRLIYVKSQVKRLKEIQDLSKIVIAERDKQLAKFEGKKS